jgi:hypothetical protein
MLSRKQFVKNLLRRGLRAVTELNLGCEGSIEDRGEQLQGYDMPSTELSPSLLEMEAERLGIPFDPSCAGELRRRLYQELAKNGLEFRAGEPKPKVTAKGG